MIICSAYTKVDHFDVRPLGIWEVSLYTTTPGLPTPLSLTCISMVKLR